MEVPHLKKLNKTLPEALEEPWLTLRLGGSELRLTPHPYEGEALFGRDNVLC